MQSSSGRTSSSGTRQDPPIGPGSAVPMTRASVTSYDSDSDGDFGDEQSGLLTKTKKTGKANLEKTPLLHRPMGGASHEPGVVDFARRLERSSDDRMLLTSGTEDEGIMVADEYGSMGVSQFQETVNEAIKAINCGVFPERIAQGSSGSYFVKNRQGKIIGVFKPKNEEPYGHLNPKWLKWFHKVFLPCCFGRSCLIPNQGYLSEAGASIVDRKLGLDVVPTTGIIKLAAPTFHYSSIDRAKARTKERIYTRYPDLGRRFTRVGLPDKTGSFQMFVTGYNDAVHWLRTWEQYPEQAPPPVTNREFQFQFERMVILDYIIRNTDRGNDNWLIKYEQAEVDESVSIPMDPQQTEEKTAAAQDEQLIDLEAGGGSSVPEPEPPHGSSNQPPELEWADVTVPKITIAAIDNGLAFPFKHPDEWRAYPFGWTFLPQARQSFSEETIERYLPLLDDANFVAELGEELRNVFKTDKGFDKKMFERQLSVMRGQIFNLREALRQRKSPYQLVLMPAQYMVEVKQKKRKGNKNRRAEAEETTWSDQDPAGGVSSSGEGAGPSSSGPSSTSSRPTRTWNDTYKQKIETRLPFFRYW